MPERRSPDSLSREAAERILREYVKGAGNVGFFLKDFFMANIDPKTLGILKNAASPLLGAVHARYSSEGGKNLPLTLLIRRPEGGRVVMEVHDSQLVPGQKPLYVVNAGMFDRQESGVSEIIAYRSDRAVNILSSRGLDAHLLLTQLVDEASRKFPEATKKNDMLANLPGSS